MPAEMTEVELAKAKSALRERVQSRNPHEKEFMQAFDEVLEALSPIFAVEPMYLKALEHIAEPERVVMFRVPWTNDKGEQMMNRGYRVQYSSVLGPYKGGLRFHPSVNLSILKFLGFEQIFKNSLTGLRMGGGKGGSDFDPKGKSDNEVKAFCQSFMTELRRHIGADTDVPAGDIGVGGREIGFMYGQYRRLENKVTGVLTGKGLNFGGSLIRPEATGYGAVYFAEAVLDDHLKDTLVGKRCLVSGSGNGCIYEPDGFTREQLGFIMHLKNVKRQRINEYLTYSKTATYFPGEKPWKIKADLAFPSACENEIMVEDAKLLVEGGVKLVVEGANMPTHNEAVHLLKQSGVIVCPGKAANAGGVAVSGLEMAQNSQRDQWTREEVDAKLKITMQNIYKQCKEACDKYKIPFDLINGANIAGFIKVASSFIDQGCI
ncbi:bifunctional Glutamate dehydrogenase/Glutamate-phenylalanine-leucine-valine dehydrogenase [Babesia duncani]|uniref:Glutamate dehydrogenase n=1 Tax=Babesia duncani TaxID=323732 RepID=A0AAD9UNE4_9APIC|nr:bifunctional Glutamate dehydrogenase/Glutamate-phenylalanine-leucine-valine dehydrogenase [Babesia duncani]KAK2195746.1 bifunctional Glutamate dehydrogenase/Glutamate-phenylalanine-leucine-valine dehydrogenase [Babesia duncani]